MQNTSRFAIAFLAGFLSCGGALGQSASESGPGTAVDPLVRAIMAINDFRDFIYHQETEEQCIGGTIHQLTFVYTFGNKGTIPLMDVDTGKMCPCPMSSDAAQLSPSAKGRIRRGSHPRQEDNCDSPDPYDDSMADTEDFNDLLNLLEGSTGPDPFARAGARPALAPMGAALSLTKSSGAATTPPGAFAFTLPFRELGAAPLLLAPPPNVAAMCLSSVNPTYWQTAHTDNQVLRFDTCTGATIATVNVTALPLEIRVTPDGTQAIVTHFSSAVSFIDTSTNAVTNVLQLPLYFTPSGLAISPDGRYALITNLEPAGPGGATMGVIDIASRTLTSTFPLDTDYPRSVYINPDATLAWVVYPFNNQVEAIDLLTGIVVRTFRIEGPESVAFNATGTVVYVAEGGGVQVIDARTYDLGAFVPTGDGAGDLLVTPDGAYVVVHNAGASSISVIDTQTLAVSTVMVSGPPRGIVAVPLQ
jgi:YVTN family beta-propeller protein